MQNKYILKKAINV